MERGAFSSITDCPYPPAVTANDPLYQGQTHARALILRPGMQSVEDIEQPIGVLHVEAHSIIADIVGAALRLEAELDKRILPVPGELDGVGKEVGHDASEHGLVPRDQWRSVGDERYVSALFKGIQLGEGLPGDRAQVYVGPHH